MRSLWIAYLSELCIRLGGAGSAQEGCQGRQASQLHGKGRRNERRARIESSFYPILSSVSSNAGRRRRPVQIN